MIKIPDILQLNDWEPKNFLRMVIAIQMAMLGAIGLDFLGLDVPVLRQVVGFVFLTFVPGIVILRFLRLHRLGIEVAVLFSVGLSISFLMFSGFFINTILSYLNIDSPLSFLYVTILITTLLNVLLILSYMVDKSYQCELQSLEISRSALYLMLLPVLSIVGTYFVNFHRNNIVLLVLIVLIALIPALIAFKKITPDLYPLAVVVIAISLLFHKSLISMYLTGFDIHGEYYFYKLAVNNAYWNSKIDSNVNAMLSIVILPAIYSYFLKMDGAWLFKIVYPIIFSLVPLGLYRVYLNLIKNDKMAFYSVFFFMSFYTFFTEMLSLARQEIAELFFVLLILLITQDTLNKNVRNALMLVFGVSLVTSHYGLSYIYIILIIIIYIFSIGTSKIKGITLPEFNLKKLTLKAFVAFYIVFALLWYMNVSSSSTFESVVNLGEHVFKSIFNDFFNPENRDRSLLMALGIVDPLVPSIGREVYRDLQFITQFFIIVGFFKIIINREFTKLKAEYFYLIIASLFILVLSVLPFSAKSLNMTRIYQIALFALSPLFIIGGIFVIENILKITSINLKQNIVVSILILSISIPYFLFNSGFIFELINDSPTSISLGMERFKHDDIAKFSFYNTYTPEQDVYSARWYYKNKNADKRTYADANSRLHVLNSYGMTSQLELYSPFKGGKLYSYNNFRYDYYLYLNNYNVCNDIFIDSSRAKFNLSVFSPIFNQSSKIYSNGCGEIYTK